jgi:CubicO group peptidase (beta-lactamase class C family)
LLVLLFSLLLPAALAADSFPPPGEWRSLVRANQEASGEEIAAVRRETGLDWEALKEGWRYCLEFEGPHSVLVIRRGWIAGEWNNFDEPRGIASCTKSLTGIAVAKLIDERRLSPDDYAWRYLPPEWASSEPERKRVRIGHMMTMSSGLDPYDGPYRDEAAYAQVIMSRKVEAEPGRVWSYNSAPVDQLSLIVEKVTGRKMSDFFKETIGARIGLAEFRWPEFMGHTGGSGGPGGGAQLRPRELARVGYMLLRKGHWGSERIMNVSLLSQWAPYLEKATFRVPNFWVTAPGSQRYYGHLFWTNRTGEALGEAVPKDTYYMSGWGMQACWIIPSLDMLVVRLGPNRGLNAQPGFYREFLARVMKAVN